MNNTQTAANLKVKKQMKEIFEPMIEAIFEFTSIVILNVGWIPVLLILGPLPIYLYFFYVKILNKPVKSDRVRKIAFSLSIILSFLGSSIIFIAAIAAGKWG